jgi:hypothetical protein
MSLRQAEASPVPKFVVAICASDAAGGGVIVPAAAERLGVPYQAPSAPRSVPNAGEDAPDDKEFMERSEREIERLRTSGGVMRDGAAVVLLSDDPSVLRVRLDGPLEARVRQGATASGRTEAEMRRGPRSIEGSTMPTWPRRAGTTSSSTRRRWTGTCVPT